MIEIKVYRILQDLRIELAIYGSDGFVGTTANWQGEIDEGDVLSELSHHLDSVLDAVDRDEGAMSTELLFGS